MVHTRCVCQHNLMFPSNFKPYCADDCWLLEVEGGMSRAMPGVRWQEVVLAYDHGVPRCWHAAALIPPGQLYLLSGLTQPYYITMALLIVNVNVVEQCVIEIGSFALVQSFFLLNTNHHIQCSLNNIHI